MPAQTDGDVRRGRGGGGGRDKEALTNDDAGIGDEEREAGRATERRRARHEYIVVEGTEASGESSRRGRDCTVCLESFKPHTLQLKPKSAARCSAPNLRGPSP